jgi:spermidine synthase
MSKKSVYGFVGLLFVVSGALGLIYQIVWFKYISLFLGNTMYAQTVVVSTFMGGLAIGATLWGRRVDRSKNPLLLYSWLELSIGLYCFLYPHFLKFLEHVFVSLVVSAQLASDSTGVLVLKLLTSLLTLLPPTILMGGTLPVLVRFISDRVEDTGHNVATLYFLNSFGAVVGSMLGGFFFVALLGLSATVYTTAALNIMIGLAGFVLANARLQEESQPAVVETMPFHEFTSFQQTAAIIVAGVSGFAAMIYEVGWVRLFIPVLGSSTYSFTLMLVGFIAGIAVGSLIVANLVRRIRNLFGFLSVCQLGIVLSMIAILPVYGRIPYYFWIVAHTLNRSETTYPIFLAIEFLFGFGIMIIPTIFMGMSLPVASRIATSDIKVLGKSVGSVFSFNTLGTVVGTLLAGLVLIPLVGIKRTIEIAVLINLALGSYVLLVDRAYRSAKKYAFLVILVAVTGLYFVFGPDWDRAVSLSGVFRNINRNTPPPASYDVFEAVNKPEGLSYYKEGASATVAVIASESPEGLQNVLYINGKADASSVIDLPTQVLLGQLPGLFHPNPHTALVVGLGSGVTVGSILTHPIERVDCVEISPEVVEAERYFEHVNNRPLSDNRTKLYVEDALAFLKLSASRYDFIVSEPSNPWIAGIGNLYTVEFFDEARKHLNSGGIMVQWFHLYEMDDETFKMVVRTFQTSFKNVSLWYSMVADVILLGSDQPIPFNYASLQSKMQEKKVQDDLARILITHPTTLLSLQALSTEKAAEYAGSGSLNTEDHPNLEYGAPRSFFVNRGVVELPKYDGRLSIIDESTFLQNYIKTHPLTDRQLLEIGMLHSSGQHGYLSFGYSVLAEYWKRNPRDYRTLDRLAEVAERLRNIEEAIQYRKILADKNSGERDYLEKYAWLKFSHERNTANAIVEFKIDDTERLLNKCIELSADTVDRYRVQLADVYLSVQEYRKAMNNYARALKIRESYAPDKRIRQDALLVQFARSLYGLGIRDRAAGYALQATWINPDNQDAKDLIYKMWTASPKAANDSSQESVH